MFLQGSFTLAYTVVPRPSARVRTLASTSKPATTPRHRQGGVAAKASLSLTLEQLLQTLTLFSSVAQSLSPGESL